MLGAINPLSLFMKKDEKDLWQPKAKICQDSGEH